MGIKGLFTFLKRWEQPVIVEEYIKGKSVGIDLFGVLYQSKGDVGMVYRFMMPFIQYAQSIHVVLDGTYATEERRVVLDQRREKRDQIRTAVEEIRNTEMMEESAQVVLDNYLHHLERQVWKPSKEYIDHIKKWCETKKVHVHEPMGEADQTLIDLESDQKIDLIVTNDSDLIAMGAEHVLRGDRLLSKVHLRIKLGCSEKQWADFMYLCRHMKEADVLLAYSLIRVYKKLDTVLSRWNEIYGTVLCEV
jgi:predicted nucleic acid-binding protein